MGGLDLTIPVIWIAVNTAGLYACPFVYDYSPVLKADRGWWAEGKRGQEKGVGGGRGGCLRL